MANLPGRPPRDAQRSPDRERGAWEREVSTLLDGSSVSLDELAQLFFALQSDKTTELESRIAELEKQLAIKPSNNYEVEINDLERRLAWVSLQKS
jgi:hypothetical protein